MASELKLRRGTAAETEVFVGAEGEVTANITDNTLHLHDGTTAGGFALARVDFANVTNETFAAKAIEAGVTGGTGEGGGPIVSGAPTNAAYLVAVLNDTLTNERRLQAGPGISTSDGGAGGGFTISASFSSTAPRNLGAASAGSSQDVARADHVHAMPTATDVGAVPVARKILASTGLAGGGALSGDVSLRLSAFVGDLNDISVTAPQNGDVLIYNSATSKFENSQSFAKLTTRQAGAVVGTNSGIRILNFTGQGVTLTADTNDASIVNVAIDKSLSQEEVEDIVGAMVSGNVEQGISVAYDDNAGKLNFDVADFSITLTGDVQGSAMVTNLGNVVINTIVTPDSVALGTDTTGNYVATLSSGTGVILTNAAPTAEGAAYTISVDTNEAQFIESIQDIIGTMVTTNTELGINVIYDDTNGKLNFDVADFTITLAGAVTGNAMVTNLGNVSITTTLPDDSVKLGQHTVGNYVASVAVSGTGLSVTGTGEGAAVTISSNATAANTANTLVARDASGNFTAGTITATLNGSANGNVLKSGDTMTGNLTMAGFVFQSVATSITAAGNSQATAAPISKSINWVTTSAASTGVRLPDAVPGMTITIINGTANAIYVYPAVGAQIDRNAVNVGVSLGANAKLQYVALSNTQWFALTAVYG